MVLMNMKLIVKKNHEPQPGDENYDENHQHNIEISEISQESFNDSNHHHYHHKNQNKHLAKNVVCMEL